VLVFFLFAVDIWNLVKSVRSDDGQLNLLLFIHDDGDALTLCERQREGFHYGTNPNLS
jgi:hypothetical protein